jgi:hypothetical protein
VRARDGLVPLLPVPEEEQQRERHQHQGDEGQTPIAGFSASAR